ncbi:hypothetical protein J4232_05345 [Candidatus Woesearchaeota archaeon]|nr:hypothetical protein [Candidatus Woesearchaeota archaeon]
MVLLGGNIELIGFEKLRNNELVVIKKMVGSFVKSVSEGKNFKKCCLTLLNPDRADKEMYKLQLMFEFDTIYIAAVEDTNLYFGLDNVCKSIERQLEKQLQ